MPCRDRSPVLVRVLLALVVVTGAPAPALAAPEDDLAAAQRKANAAAAELSEALEEMGQADDAVAHLQRRVASAERRVEAVRSQVRQLAIRLYVEGTGTLTRLLRMADANQIVRSQQFGHALAGTSTDSLRQYRVDRADLRAELEALEKKQEKRAGALENLRRRQSEVVGELERLARVVEQAQAAEQARAAADAARAANSRDPSIQRSREVASSGTPTPTTPAAGQAADPAPGAPSAIPATLPAPPAAPAVASGGWICPVQGPHAFSNDWGASRGGGYSHQGNDILAARGTPVVANVDGVVTHRSGAVSGLAYYLHGDDGNEYFGAHLDSFGASGRVTAGTQIGTVGNTGDAVGGPPHLHFEIHPGGGSPVNPYPTLVKYC